MKYALIKCVNGNFSVVSEHGEDQEKGIIAYLNQYAALLAAKDVITAEVRLVDELFNVASGCSAYINHKNNEE